MHRIRGGEWSSTQVTVEENTHKLCLQGNFALLIFKKISKSWAHFEQNQDSWYSLVCIFLVYYSSKCQSALLQESFYSSSKTQHNSLHFEKGPFTSYTPLLQLNQQVRVTEHGMSSEKLWAWNENKLVMRDFCFHPHTELHQETADIGRSHQHISSESALKSGRHLDVFFPEDFSNICIAIMYHVRCSRVLSLRRIIECENKDCRVFTYSSCQLYREVLGVYLSMSQKLCWFHCPKRWENKI